MSQLFALGGQSIGASVSASVLPKGLISFRIDWFDLLAVQGTLKNLLQHHSVIVKQLYSNNQKITIIPKWITILPANTVFTCHEAQGRKF